MESVKTYINREIANEDERKFLMEKANKYSKSIQEITKDVKDITMKTASTLKKRAYAPTDPRESLHALYVLEEKITNIINNILVVPSIDEDVVPSIDVETMKELLDLDAKLYENKLNNLIELIFNLYNKTVLGNEDNGISISNTQKLLFIGYLFCEPQPKNIDGKNLEESPIPYNILFATKDMSDKEIDEEFNRICKFEKEANIEDKEQPIATTVFERVPLDSSDGDVVMVQPAKKQKKEGGKKSKKKNTKNNKNKARKTKKNKRSLKKKAHKKK
jgi:hypothetical protein